MNDVARVCPPEESVRIACLCGGMTRSGAFCEFCGTPIRRVQFPPAARRTDPVGAAPIPPLTRTGLNAAPGTVACSWCGMFSELGTCCQFCGSALPDPAPAVLPEPTPVVRTGHFGHPIVEEPAPASRHVAVA